VVILKIYAINLTLIPFPAWYVVGRFLGPQSWTRSWLPICVLRDLWVSLLSCPMGTVW